MVQPDRHCLQIGAQCGFLPQMADLPVDKLDDRESGVYLGWRSGAQSTKLLLRVWRGVSGVKILRLLIRRRRHVWMVWPSCRTLDNLPFVEVDVSAIPLRTPCVLTGVYRCDCIVVIHAALL